MRMPLYMRLILAWQILRGVFGETIPTEYPDRTLEVVLRSLKKGSR